MWTVGFSKNGRITPIVLKDMGVQLQEGKYQIIRETIEEAIANKNCYIIKLDKEKFGLDENGNLRLTNHAWYVENYFVYAAEYQDIVNALLYIFTIYFGEELKKIVKVIGP